MDSKYNCIEPASPSAHFNSFSVKKKFSNGMTFSSNANSSISPAKKLKKSNENGLYFTKGLSGGSSSSVGNTFVPHISIEDQRKQLPVYQVKSW